MAASAGVGAFARMVRASLPARPHLPIWNALSAAGKVFAQNRSELVGDLLALPCGILAATGKHSDRSGELGVGGKRSMRVGIGAQNVGQHDRIAMIRLRPRHAVALPIAARLSGLTAYT